MNYNVIVAEYDRLLCEKLNISVLELLDFLWELCEDDIDLDYEDIKDSDNLLYIIWNEYMLQNYEGSEFFVYIWRTDSNGNNKSNTIPGETIDSYILNKLKDYNG